MAKSPPVVHCPAEIVIEKIPEQFLHAEGYGWIAKNTQALPVRSLSVVGSAIRDRRRRLEMSQIDLGIKMGVSRSLVSQWESGRTRVPADNLERLAGVLSVTQGYLVGESPAPATGRREPGIGSDRYDQQEQIIISIFAGMSDTERERLIRVAYALRE